MTSTNEYIAGWIGHRKSLIELIDALKDEDLQFKPWDGAMSVHDLVLHTTGAMISFADAVKTGSFNPSGEQKTAETIAELKKIVEEQTDQTKAQLEALTEDQLNGQVDFLGNPMPAAAVLQLARDHEIHHKGQLFTYARIAGAEKLPSIVVR